ncbi:hypothetical protein ACFC5X_05160 [Streptomyces sp. NPDC055952]
MPQTRTLERLTEKYVTERTGITVDYAVLPENEGPTPSPTSGRR